MLNYESLLVIIKTENLTNLTMLYHISRPMGTQQSTDTDGLKSQVLKGREHQGFSRIISQSDASLW